MAKFEKGERVELTQNLQEGLFGTIPSGTQGVVRELTGGTFSAQSYRVKFNSGEEQWVDEKHLIPA